MLTEGRSAVLVCLALFLALRSAICQQDTVCYKKVTQSYIQTQLIYFSYPSFCGTTFCYKTGTNVIYTTVTTYDTILDCCPGHENYPTCDDVNECETDNGGCEQQCHNTNGSFFCSCDPSYSLHSDGKTCLLESSELDVPATTMMAEPETASSVLIPHLLLAAVTAIIVALVITVAAVIVLCIMFNKKDSVDTSLRTTSLQSRILSHHVRRASNRPTQNSTGSSRSPPSSTFIPVINPGYEIRTSIPAPVRMAGHRTDGSFTSDNQPRSLSQLSSGVRRFNPLYEGVDENEDTV